MKKICSIFILCLFFLSLSEICFSDEIGELKKQIKAMQGILNEQASQINQLKDKVERLEKEKEAKIKSPQEVTDRVRALEEKVSGENTFKTYWKNGLKFTTADKKFDLGIGGRLQVDSAYMQEESKLIPQVGELEDAAEVRRLRLNVRGSIYEDFIYKVQLDFAGGDADIQDAYMGYKDLPYIGTIKAGHFQEPFSLNQLTSNKYITFMERSSADVFSPGRNLGIMLNNNAFNKRVSWQAGIFRDADSYVRVTSNEYNFTGRVTGLPWYEDDGEKLLHLGIAYSFRNPEETLRYRQRPEAHLAPNFVNTGNLPVHYANLIGYEAAGVYGPFSVQSEFMQSFVNEQDGPSDTYFQGTYVQASYFLTGEHRNYSKSNGIFSRIKPNENFSLKDETWGAWEIAARYSYLDLKDNSIDGGIMNNVTIGINWYLNPNMRIMGNYVHSNLNGKGSADIFMTRFQVDF